VTNILILYSSIEGHTARIAERMALALRAQGHDVTRRQALAGERPDLSAYDAVIVGASIHYGHHPAFLRPVLRDLRNELDRRPNAFFSVSLCAGAGPGAKPVAARRYVDTFLREVEWQPQATATFGGALRFDLYPWWKRLLLKLVLTLTGRDTDTTHDHEYTDWEAVEHFAEAFGARLKTGQGRS
jgi:menaquinone-dependent protoporphyrinogen oxidase